MALKTLLVCLHDTDHAETLMAFAVNLARKHKAHLIGLHAVEGLIIYPAIAMHVPDPAFVVVRKRQAAVNKALRECFERHTKVEDFGSEWRFVRCETSTASDHIVECARAADAVIMAQPGEDFFQMHALKEVIRESGRPVIMVPANYKGPTIGDSVVLGWSDTREASRAAHDLVAVVDKGAQVSILHVNGDTDALKETDSLELAVALARHDIEAEIVHSSSAESSVADVLEKVAFEKGADLIVTGAFGHSKVYDFVLGAVTYALLDHSKLPVLFSN